MCDEEQTKPAAVWAAEVVKLEAEAAEAMAKARKETALGVQQEMVSRVGAINLEEAERKYLASLVTDERCHVYAFNGSVSGPTAQTCATALRQWVRLDKDKEKKSPIEIVFQSPGGEVIPGMALFDVIQQVRAAGHHVTTATIGYAASMAGILLQAGDVRVMGAESYILIHEISAGAMGKTSEIEDELAFLKKIQGRVIAIFVKRSNLSKAVIERKWRKKDWWIDSTEALKIGLVDEIR